jgi:hypothetical protein
VDGRVRVGGADEDLELREKAVGLLRRLAHHGKAACYYFDNIILLFNCYYIIIIITLLFRYDSTPLTVLTT